MTVESVIQPDKYDGDGSTRDWAITFAVDNLSETDFEIYVASNGLSALITTGYEVNLSTPEVTYPTVASGLDVLTSSQEIIIKPVLALKQEFIDVATQGSIPLPGIEAGFDKVVLMLQQQQEEIDRSVKTDISETGQTTDELLSSISEAESSCTASATSATASAISAASSAASIPEPTGEDVGDIIVVNSTQDGWDFTAPFDPTGGENVSLGTVGAAGIVLTESTAPSTSAGEGAVYTKDIGGQPELVFREESSGDEVQMSDSGMVASPIGTISTDFLASGTSTSTSYADAGLDIDYAASSIEKHICVIISGTAEESSTSDTGLIALKVGSDSEILPQEVRGSSVKSCLSIIHVYKPATTSSIVYKARIQTSGAGTTVKLQRATMIIFEI